MDAPIEMSGFFQRTIKEVYQMRNKRIDVEDEERKIYKLNVPDYQRCYVWKDKMQNALIKTILTGFSQIIPVIYLHDQWYQPGKGVNIPYYDILDGRQRITAIKRFIKNKYKVKLEGEMVQFKDLSQDQRDTFMHAQLTFRNFKCDEDVAMKIFRSINRCMPLTTAERMKAKNSTASFLIYSDHTQQLFNVLSERKATKTGVYVQGDFQFFIAKLIAALLTENEPVGDSEIFDFVNRIPIEEHEDHPFYKMIDVVRGIVANKECRPGNLRKTDLFTLCYFVYKHIDNPKLDLFARNYPRVITATATKQLQGLSGTFLKVKTRYNGTINRGTNRVWGTGVTEIRCKILEELMVPEPDPLEDKPEDEEEVFVTPKRKRAKLSAQPASKRYHVVSSVVSSNKK